jgi:hypothetical protein
VFDPPSRRLSRSVLEQFLLKYYTYEAIMDGQPGSDQRIGETYERTVDRLEDRSDLFLDVEISFCISTILH